MATPPKLLASEMAAGQTAAQAYMDANVPGWQRAFIKDEMIQQVVAEIVSAVDDVRATASESNA